MNRLLKNEKREYQIVGERINALTKSFFNKYNIKVIIGFGSYWQNETNMTIDSDIDFFVLLEKQPSIKDLIKYKESINNENIKYQLSPQIFVGDIIDVCNGYDNILRIIHMNRDGIKKPVLLYGSMSDSIINNINFKNINEVLKSNLFLIIRHLNHNAITTNNISDTLCIQRKILLRYVDVLKYCIFRSLIHTEKYIIDGNLEEDICQNKFDIVIDRLIKYLNGI